MNFTLSRGKAIRGLVTDPTGAPVNGAKVMATSLLPKQPQTEEVRTVYVEFRDGVVTRAWRD